MDGAKLSPDGHTVAFTSPVDGVAQVFVMLTSGGEPLQLTKDEGAKFVDSFSPDGTQIYYGRSTVGLEIWAVPTLGGNPRRAVAAFSMAPSPDGAYLYYLRQGKRAILRADKSGMGEEEVYALGCQGIAGPKNSAVSGRQSLAGAEWKGRYAGRRSIPCLRSRSQQEDGRRFGRSLSESSGRRLGRTRQVAFGQPHRERPQQPLGVRSEDKCITQIDSGTGPDMSPMRDPAGNKAFTSSTASLSGILTAYNLRSKQSTDIAAENATQPVVSWDGKRNLLYHYSVERSQ